MRFLRSFGRFWYDFVIGDDWKIAAAVVLALGTVVGLLRGKVFGDHTLAVVGAAIIVAFFAVSLAIDVRPKKDKR
jgi:uncharacterized membrane protein YoaK (UPF0700 family)